MAPLSENFTWTPCTLLAVVREIDKICPEEGILDLRDLDYGNRNTDDDNRPMINQQLFFLN
jgi:hypothetical protein